MVPQQLGNLTKLEVLDLGNEDENLVMDDILWFSHLQSLKYLDVSGSMIAKERVLMQVRTLYLNDNLIDGTLPSSLCDMELIDLNLANNSLSGSIPDCWKDSLSFLTLSFNKLSGVIPSSLGSLPHLTTLHLNGNRLNGELPQALDYCTSLTILDLGENNFSGSIPTWFDESFNSLLILRLRENRFVGNIPPQLCSLSRLKILDMAVNNLTGMIPHCLGNMSGMINLNQINSFGSVAITPFEAIDWGQEHVVEIMKGRYNEYTRIVLQLVVNLDLSSNFLNGSIPEELSFLSELHGLNLSHNHLSGNIPIGIGNMTSLESLDLSNNHLSGTIPQSISALTSLARLNLSQNDLMGQIPKGNQIQTLDDPSIYAGNPLLCGDLLRNKCLSAKAPQPQKIPHPEDTHEEDKLDRTLFYAVVMLGFTIGFWGFFGVLQFKKDWRRAYFSFADQVAHKAYVAIVVKVAKLKRLRLSRSV
ncbi:receptor-like protein EIX2 [Eucalyptus grandis]|uniref:receptor-like protein EIX2 n=1 Tax=Eucalyptus grandis TaxID=71139 RepID=UPI00192EB2E7|nr:receptor-like protein EIX2 [Eucalyptus grandis]